LCDLKLQTCYCWYISFLLGCLDAVIFVFIILFLEKKSVKQHFIFVNTHICLILQYEDAWEKEEMVIYSEYICAPRALKSFFMYVGTTIVPILREESHICCYRLQIIGSMLITEWYFLHTCLHRARKPYNFALQKHCNIINDPCITKCPKPRTFHVIVIIFPLLLFSISLFTIPWYLLYYLLCFSLFFFLSHSWCSLRSFVL